MFKGVLEPPRPDLPKPKHELPKYDPSDPNEEPSKWTFSRLARSVTVERPVPWTKTGDQPVDDEHPDWRGVIKKNVIPMPPPGDYKFGPPLSPKYYFFDTPDYADPFKKLWWSISHSAQAGALAAPAYAIFTNMPFGLQEGLTLTRKIFLPVFIAGVATTTAVTTIANLRGNKDDYYNWLMGGLVGAASVGYKDYMRFNKAALLIVPLAFTAKYINEHNEHMIPQTNPRIQATPLSGIPADDGTMASGDFRMGIRYRIDDPGRDVRRYA